MSGAAQRQAPSWPIAVVHVIVGSSFVPSVPLMVRDILDEQLARKLAQARRALWQIGNELATVLRGFEFHWPISPAARSTRRDICSLGFGSPLQVSQRLVRVHPRRATCRKVARPERCADERQRDDRQHPGVDNGNRGDDNRPDNHATR